MASSDRVTLTIRGSPELEAGLLAARDAVLPVLIERQLKLGHHLQNRLAAATPRGKSGGAGQGSGDSVASQWRVSSPRTVGGAVVVEVSNPSPAVGYLVEGTRPHLIAARPGGTLAWLSPEGVRFAAYVNHPGTRPNPFVDRVLDDEQHEIDAFIADVLDEVLRIAARG